MTDNLDLTNYSGKWAAIFDEEIVASADTPEELMVQIEEKELEKDELSIILVPKEEETHHILEIRN